jgi:D-alanyl-D-alanine carboxypeptidase (penicillin-binding protein 5/6)
VKSVDQKTVHPLKNSNRLTTGEIPLDGIVGGKTGYTPDAGHTLVCAATRNGHTLISVILKTYSNAPSATAEETRSLLTWGFESYDF